MKAHLDHFSNLSIADSEEAHLENARLETELNETVDGRVADNSCFVNGRSFPRSILRDGVEVIVGDTRDLNMRDLRSAFRRDAGRQRLRRT